MEYGLICFDMKRNIIFWKNNYASLISVEADLSIITNAYCGASIKLQQLKIKYFVSIFYFNSYNLIAMFFRAENYFIEPKDIFIRSLPAGLE